MQPQSIQMPRAPPQNEVEAPTRPNPRKDDSKTKKKKKSKSKT